MIGGWYIYSEFALMWLPMDLTDDVKIASGDGFVPSGNNSLPEAMLTQIYVAIWRHQGGISKTLMSS